MGLTDPFAALVDSLPKSARAAYPFLRSAALDPANLSANKILQNLKDAGFPLRRETGLDIIAVVRNRADVAQYVRTFGTSAIIPDSIHKLSPVTFSGGNRVVYEVGTNSLNPLIPKAIYVAAPANLSADQIFGKATASFSYEEGSGMAAGDLSDVVFSVDDARYSPGSQLTGQFADDTAYSGA
jgi:hypothetical protein